MTTVFPGEQIVINTPGVTFLTGNLAMSHQVSDEDVTLFGSSNPDAKWGGHWFYFTAHTNGKLFIDFYTASNPQGNTGFSAFTGADYEHLTRIAGPASSLGNDVIEEPWNGLPVTAGTTYYLLVVSGHNDDTGYGKIQGIGTSSSNFGPIVLKDPDDITVNEGASFSFRSIGVGSPEPSQQWQKHPPAFGEIDEVGWVVIPGENSEYLYLTASLEDDGWLYRSVYSSSVGGVFSDAFSAPATMTIGEIALPGFTDDWDDVTIPDATVGDGVPDSGSATVLELVRQFSYDTRQAVRIIDDHNIEIVNLNDPLPIGIAQADAAAMYHSVTRTAQAGEKTLSLEENDLILTATAEITTDDVRIIKSAWQLPNRLPVMGLAPAVVSRVSYSFSPEPGGFTGSLELVYLTPLAIVRRSA